MAFMLADELDNEIWASFDCENQISMQPENEERKVLFREHKKFIVKSLNRKNGIFSHWSPILQIALDHVV